MQDGVTVTDNVKFAIVHLELSVKLVHSLAVGF